MPHIPALDGLRGLALIAVLLFHAGFGWAQGGFLGVTAFFTLSGFLITALMLTEHQDTGRIDLQAFWARRARRLVPASLALLALVGLFVAAGGRRPAPGVVGDAIASATWAANWRFVFAERSYDDLFASPSPFQHLWSLAVEEQVYLALPLVVVAVTLLAGVRRRAALATALIVLIGVSVALSAALHTPGQPPLRAYYGTDTRMAEPLVGALLAVILVRPGGLRLVGDRWRPLVGGLGSAGLAGLVAMVALIGERDTVLYEGGFLLAAICSAGLVWAAVHPGTHLAGLLSDPLLGAIGRVSYGAYLFHWPIYVWVDERSTGLSTVPLLLVRLALTFGLAVVSYHVIEQPIRTGRVPFRPALLGWANATVGLVGVLVLAASLSVPARELSASGEDPSVAPPVPAGTAAATDPAHAPPVPNAAAAPAATARVAPGTGGSQPRPASASPTAAAPQSGGAAGNQPSGDQRADPPVSQPPTEDPLRVAVIGDSVASNLARGVRAWAGNRGDVVLYDLSIKNCPLSRGGERRLPDDSAEWPIAAWCDWWAEPYSERRRGFDEFDPDVVVVQDAFNELVDRRQPQWPQPMGPGEPVFDAWLLGEYRELVRALQTSGAAVMFTNAMCADWDRNAMWAELEDADARVAALNERVYPPLRAAGVEVADLHDRVCPGGRYRDEVEGVPDGRYDGFHLSDEAATRLVDRWLGPMIISLAYESGRSFGPR